MKRRLMFGCVGMVLCGLWAGCGVEQPRKNAEIEVPYLELDIHDGQTRKLEVRRAMVGYRATLLFYTFPEQNAVLKLRVGNQDTTFPVSGTIYFFAATETDETMGKWLNNQHSDGLYVEIPDPVESYSLPADVCTVASHKFIDHAKEQMGEYDNYAVTLNVKSHSEPGFFKLKGFAVDTKVHIKTK